MYLHIASAKSSEKSSVSIYQFSYGQKSIIKKGSLGFYPYDQIYLMHENQSAEYATTIKKNLLDQKHLNIFGIYKLPFKPLMGINAPAIGIEIGIASLDDLNMIISHLNHALQQFLNSM